MSRDSNYIEYSEEVIRCDQCGVTERWDSLDLPSGWISWNSPPLPLGDWSPAEAKRHLGWEPEGRYYEFCSEQHRSDFQAAYIPVTANPIPYKEWLALPRNIGASGVGYARIVIAPVGKYYRTDGMIGITNWWGFNESPD